jgi:hypothetical protein
MADFLGIFVASGFVIVGAAGVVFGTRDFRLFRGDVMERYFKLMASGFLLVTAVSLGDAALLAAGQTVPTLILSLALMASAAVFLIGLMSLARLAGGSKADQLA